ncbi:MAG: serine--tRNA ligase [Nanoarchaeota archaeon]|nr:serine--tRNA ligase [Nanoarchaeota archaeon]
MLDIKFIVENSNLVKDNLKKRFKKDRIWMIDELVKDYEHQKILQKKVEDIRARRNYISKEINQLKKKKQDVSKQLKEASSIPQKLAEFEEDLELLREKINEKMLQIPNMLHEKVPIGEDASKNQEVKKIGTPKKFSYELVNHEDLAEKLNIADFDAGRTVSGQGFNYIFGELAQLDNALQRYGIDFLIKKGFTLVVPPLMLNKKYLSGTVNLADFEEVIYKIENEDLFLIGTAENPLVAMLHNKTLNTKDLPIKLCAVTPCFRKEIGGHGVDSKGLFRMHQFNKVEQVMLTAPKDSFKELENLQKISEDFFKSLEIPIRVIEICSGDLGDKQARQYDIEAWFPRQKAYKEVTSASSCTDYQSRKLNIKLADENDYVHILNNTMVATSRAMVAILENFQQKDGSVKVPKVLHKYLNFTEIKSKN